MSILSSLTPSQIHFSEGHAMYMGKDKHENEMLLANGWPEDVWFHVDDLSSAHVYIRLPAVS